MDFLSLFLQREAIIALAIGGAILATVGSYLGNKGIYLSAQSARRMRQMGYSLSWFSVVLFIVAGFLAK